MSWRRADYLRLCFNSLLNARGIQDKDVWVFQNNRQDIGIDLSDVHSVIREFSELFSNFKCFDAPQPNGMLAHYNAWETVYESGAPRAYFILDDVVVTPDFFEWHESVQSDQDWFGSTAWRPGNGNDKPFDVTAYYQVSFPNEISIGFCAKRTSIKVLLQSPPDWYPVRRMVDENWKIAMPYVPRAYHIGSYSSQLDSVGANTGNAIDILPNPIPDYGRQTVVLK